MAFRVRGQLECVLHFGPANADGGGSQGGETQTLFPSLIKDVDEAESFDSFQAQRYFVSQCQSLSLDCIEPHELFAREARKTNSITAITITFPY